MSNNLVFDLLLVLLARVQGKSFCDVGSVRFYNSTAFDAAQGLVEVCHNDTWFKACLSSSAYDSASDYATTTCIQLGFSAEGLCNYVHTRLHRYLSAQSL